MRRKRPWRQRLIFVGALWADRRRRYDKALGRVDALEALGPLQLHERAFKAMLLLRNAQPERSHALFLEVREAAKALDDPDHRYVRHYSQAWLARIRDEPFNVREQERKAAATDCAPWLKGLLWLPDGDDRDPLDDEFDAWVEANAPEPDDLGKRRGG